MDYAHLSIPGKSRKLVLRRIRKNLDNSVTLVFVDKDAPRAEPVILKLTAADSAAITNEIDSVLLSGTEVTRTLDPELETELPPKLRSR